MSSFSEFSKEANKPHNVAKNRVDPKTGKERQDRESIKDLHEGKDNPRTTSTSDRSQNRDNAQTSRL